MSLGILDLAWMHWILMMERLYVQVTGRNMVVFLITATPKYNATFYNLKNTFPFASIESAWNAIRTVSCMKGFSIICSTLTELIQIQEVKSHN